MPSSSTILPLEIEETILNLLSDEALKTCSLVCQAFLPTCRKHIFGSIVLNGYGASGSAVAFERLLRETPEIADYIRKLDYTFETADLISPSIQESLKRISRLEFFTLRKLNWRYNLNSIRPALLHLLHLTTLTHFEAVRVNRFLLSDLIPCINLKYLNFSYSNVASENSFPSTFPEHSIHLNEFVGTTTSATMKLYTARRPDGKPIIDFGSLHKITVDIEGPNENKALQELFRHCNFLTYVDISCKRYLHCHHQDFNGSLPLVWDPHHVRPILADMLRPSMLTLKHIILHIYVDEDVDLLIDFPSEFEDMRTNVIETVAIRIMVQTDAGYRREDWGRLDKVFTAPGWFSLKRVSLVLEIDSSDNASEVTFRNTLDPETQFPRLSSSNSVSFDFKVNPGLA